MTTSFYCLTLKDGGKAALPSETFLERTQFPGGNFQTRLAQLQQFYPNAIDWSLEDTEAAIEFMRTAAPSPKHNLAFEIAKGLNTQTHKE